MPVSGAGEATLTVLATSPGILVFTLEEHGVSVLAHVDSQSPVASPVARLGTMVLLANTATGISHTLHVASDDPHDPPGEVCAVVDLVRMPGSPRVVGDLAFSRAGKATQQKNWAVAFEQYLAAARAYDRSGVQLGAARGRHAMAELAYRRLDRKRDSFALAGAALAAYRDFAASHSRQSVDPVFLGVLIALQAKDLMEMPGADPARLASEVRTLLHTARRLEGASAFGVPELARVEILTGFLEYNLEAPRKAAELFAATARRCRQARDWDCYATASQNLGAIAEETNDYATALAVYADAARSLSNGSHLKLAADISNNLGRVQGVVGLFSSSERSHAAAMRDYATLGDCPGVRRTLAWSGSLMVQVGTLGDAENKLHQAAAFACPALLALSHLPVEPDLTATHPGSTSLDAWRGNLCAHPVDPAALGRENRMVVFDALLSLNDALELEGEPSYARRCLDAAAAYAIEAHSQMRLAEARGEALLERKDANGALQSFRRALQVADAAQVPPANEHRGSAQLGLVRAQLLSGNTADALGPALHVLQASVARGDIDQTVASLRLVAAAYRLSARTAEAARTLQVAATLTESVPIDELDGEKRATFLATQHAVFAELMDLFASQAVAGAATGWQAFETSERGRARSLRYAVSQSTRDAATASDVPPAARYQQLLRNVIRLDAANTSRMPEGLIDALGRAAGSAARPSLDKAGLARTLVRLGATLVEYAAGTHEMFAFIVDASGLQVLRLADRATIATAAAELRAALRGAETPASRVRAAAARLAGLVFWPLRERLTGHRIIFVPDEALHTIPVAVLPWSEAADSERILQRAQTSIAPSAGFLTNVHEADAAANAAPRITLLGDPVFRVADWRRECIQGVVSPARAPSRSDRTLTDWAESLPRLPGTRAEVAMVAKLARRSYPSSHVETLLGCAAIAASLRSAADHGTDLLHIATHARVDAQRPRLSALALTPDRLAVPASSTFGLLDILGLRLHSRLVVLSACDTSRGKLLPGEGVLGPAQAFLQAGSAAVLASYWRVDDQATAAFMTRFYEHLLVEHLPAADALRRAQLDSARVAGSHDWAAFALYGWPDSTM